MADRGFEAAGRGWASENRQRPVVPDQASFQDWFQRERQARQRWIMERRSRRPRGKLQKIKDIENFCFNFFNGRDR